MVNLFMFFYYFNNLFFGFFLFLGLYFGVWGIKNDIRKIGEI